MSTTERENDLQNRVDSPLVNPKDDCLDRKRIAERIFALINNTPPNTSLRVGILGSWGSGKTTVLNFIKHQCEDKKCPVAFFHPWQFNSREDAWTGFVSSLDNALASWGKLSGKKLPVGIFKKKRIIKNISEKARRITEIVNTDIGKAIGDLVLAPLENQLAESKQNVNKELKKILGEEKRFYIFIDDLDRSEPDIVYDMLMLLNEIVDLDQCVYIIGLDVKTISEVLTKKLNYTNPKEFIDKIINWPFELPIPSSLDWEILLDKEYERIKSSGIKKDTILNIRNTLPKNPRKFKHYVRYLGGLHQAFLNQLGDKERDWELLYLCQLLNLEFPDISRDLRQDNEIMNDLTFRELSDLTNNLKSKNISAETNWVDKIKKELEKYGDIDVSRFFEIYQAIREKMSPYHSVVYSGIFREHIRKHLFVIEYLELITKKRYCELKKKLLSLEDQNLKYELEELIANSKDSKGIGRVQEFMKMLLQDKDKIFEYLIGLPAKDEIKPQIEKCKEIIHICDLFADIDELYRVEKPIFDEATFVAWYGSLLHQGRFVESDDLYEKLHNRQKALLLKVVKKNLKHASEMCKWLYEQLENTSGDKTTENIQREIRDILYKELAKELLNRFRKNNGIKEAYLKLSIEHDFLSDSDSPFYSEESYKKLKAIADEAGEDIIVYGNLVDFLLLIWQPIAKIDIDGSYGNLRKIMQKKKFFETIWQAVVCRPLNVRYVGTFEKAIKKLLTEKIIDEDYFKRPEWWYPILDENKERK